MTTYYVGPGGSDAANGLSWANRKLTLNGAEDIPVAAGDTVYVGPGTYRATSGTNVLAIDVSGTAGNPITYVGDVTGENTDGIGGPVRITGVDSDGTTLNTVDTIRATTAKSYRTFRGLWVQGGGTSRYGINFLGNGTNNIVEDCVFADIPYGVAFAYTADGTYANTVRRCVFYSNRFYAVYWPATATVENATDVLENCLFLGGSFGARIDRCGGITINGCFLHGVQAGFRVWTALSVTATAVSVKNCIFQGGGGSAQLQGTVSGEIVEDYNTFFANGTDRSLVATGTNSVTMTAPMQPPLLLDGHRLPQPYLGMMHRDSTLLAKVGSSIPADDMYGITRPVTSGKMSWGPVQVPVISRETTTKRTGAASIKLADAGRHQVFVPVTAVSTVFSVYVYREADYTGTLPQMIIKQPGVADDTTTDTGSVSTWNQLTRTMTPAATPGYVIVELVSNNTAAATNFDVFFDDLTVT